MEMNVFFKICDPSKSFLLGINSLKSEKYNIDLKTNKQVKQGGIYTLSIGFLLFEIVLTFNYSSI